MLDFDNKVSFLDVFWKVIDNLYYYNELGLFVVMFLNYIVDLV